MNTRSRRFFAGSSLAVALAITLALGRDARAQKAATEKEASPTAAQALQRLMDGNQRFVTGHRLARGDDAAARAKLANTQKPFAIVFSCSDSRVGPEVVFDQDLGDIFVIRTAGQVIDDAALGSIEYAVDHLGTPLVLVLGHERCGAVTAAVSGGEAPGHIAALVKAIQPAVAATKGQTGDAVDNAVRENVRDVVAQLRVTEPIIAPAVRAGKVEIVGARYDLDTGLVEVVHATAK